MLFWLRSGLYLYSQKPVGQDILYPFQQADITPWMDGITCGQYLHFDLLASPCKKKFQFGAHNSQRRLLCDPEERQQWLARKAAASGFRILHAEEVERVVSFGIHSKEKGGHMRQTGFRYTGTLQVLDADAFRCALSQGIGPGKAYGYGMLLVKQT